MSNGFAIPYTQYGQVVVSETVVNGQTSTYCFRDMSQLVNECVVRAGTYELINHLTPRLTHATEAELTLWSNSIGSEIARRMADRLKTSAISTL